MAKKIRIKGYKVKGYSRSLPKDSRKKKVIKVKPQKKRGVQQAENAIRDMFLSRQYNKVVPVKDINTILKSPKWTKRYRKINLKYVFKDLVEDKYIIKKGKNYIWQG